MTKDCSFSFDRSHFAHIAKLDIKLNLYDVSFKRALSLISGKDVD